MIRSIVETIYRTIGQLIEAMDESTTEVWDRIRELVKDVNGQQMQIASLEADFSRHAKWHEAHPLPAPIVDPDATTLDNDPSLDPPCPTSPPK
jgi:hypothetical protein